MTDFATLAANAAYPNATTTRAILITEQIQDDGTRALTHTGSHGLTTWDALGMLEMTCNDIRKMEEG